MGAIYLQMAAARRRFTGTSREAAKGSSPRRKPWVRIQK
jgi:hypothetical protein